jgi:cytochrome bd-type quinol oxidase subunit 2
LKANFWRRYGDAIRFNRNIIISGIGSFFAGALVSQFYSGYDSENSLANSAVTLAAEYGVYIPAFALLFYMGNRRRYIDLKTGRRNSRAIRDDVKKLLAAFSVSEVIYSVAKFGSQYQLLQSGTKAYQASMIASAVAWAVFLVAVNAMARATRLFGQKQPP